MTWLTLIFQALGYGLLAAGVGVVLIIAVCPLIATPTRDERAPETSTTRVNHTGEVSLESGPRSGTEGQPQSPTPGAAVPARNESGAPAPSPGSGRRLPHTHWWPS